MKSKTYLLLILFMGIMGCRKDDQPDIPYVYVNEILYPNSLDYIPVSGYKYVSAGYRGLIVYRSSMEEFSVFERCCPYDPEKVNARVIVNSDNMTATDTCCNSTYDIIYGNLISGPSDNRFSLLTYHCNYDGEKLYIYN